MTRPLKFFIILGLLLMTAHAPAAIAKDRILDIQEITTPKGITLWHVEDRSLPILTIHFAFKGAGAVNDPADKIGLGQLVSNTIDEGAGTRTATQFQQALQDHAIELSFENSRDVFSGKMKTLKRHDALAFELLRDAIHTPLFDEEAIERMRQANIMRIKSSFAKPDWLAARLMNDVYFGDHPYANNSGGTISGLTAVTADDMRGFVTEFFTRSNVVVSTAGDISADEAAAIVDKIFGDLPISEKTMDLQRVIPPATSLKKAFKTQSPQSVVQMIWPAIDKNDPDYHAYSVMNHMLGGGGFSSYLMEEVREKRGLTYGIYSQPVFLDYSNYLMIESATSPENIAPMTTAMQDVLSKLTTETVDEKLLADAKSYLIGSLPLRFTSTLSLSGAAMRMQLDGRSITALDDWADKIDAITADDVKNVANRIFKSIEPTVTIIAGAVPDDSGFELVEKLPGIE